MTEGYKLASGYNVILGSLVDIETISVSGQKFAGPKVQYFYGHGKREFRADGSVYDNGYPYVIWNFGILYFPQYAYLMSTYGSSGWSGQVTILTTLNDPASFSRMNAQMVIPQQTDLKVHQGWYIDVPIAFTRLAASS